MIEKLRFPLIFIFTMIVTFLYAHYFGTVGFFIYIGIIATAAILLVKWGELYSFIAVITVVLAMAFIDIYKAFINPSMAYQIHMVSEQLLGASMILSYWLMMVLVYRETRRRHICETTLKQLEKIDPVSNVLTINEFFDELFYLSRRLARREEPATLITLTVNTIDGVLPAKVAHIMGQLLLESIRVGYDIVGREGNIFLIALQGTDENNADIVIQRIMDKMDNLKHIDGKALKSLISVSKYPLSGNYDANKALISQITGGITK